MGNRLLAPARAQARAPVLIGCCYYVHVHVDDDNDENENAVDSVGR